MSSDKPLKIFLAGNDFFIAKELDKLKEKFEDYDDFSAYGDELSVEEFYSFINSASMFSDGKYAVIHSFDKIKDQEAVYKACQGCSESNIILTQILTPEKKDAGKKLLASLDENGFKTIIEQKPNRSELISMMRKNFSDKGLSINQRFAEEIYEIFGGNMTLVNAEIDKLSLFFHYKKPKNEEEIMAQIAAEKQENIFNFIDSFSNRRKNTCLTIYNSFIKHMENFGMLYILLFKRMKTVYLYKAYPNKVREAVWMMEKIKTSASKWKLSEMSDLIGEFADCDYKIKTGQLRIENSILKLIEKL